MIRRDIERGWILFNQHDHAKLAGEIMNYWGNDDFTPINPKEEVLFAVSNHDSGWIEWDNKPKINKNNKYPMNFMEMYEDEQHDIWVKCFEYFSDNHKYASALIALHFNRFNNISLSKKPGNSSSKKLKNKIESFIDDMISNLDNEKNDINSEILKNLKYVQIGDIISLNLCHGWQSAVLEDIPNYRNSINTDIKLNSADGYNYKISPYPFSKNCLNFKIKGKRLLKKTFNDSKELNRELNKAPFEYFYFTIEK